MKTRLIVFTLTIIVETIIYSNAIAQPVNSPYNNLNGSIQQQIETQKEEIRTQQQEIDSLLKILEKTNVSPLKCEDQSGFSIDRNNGEYHTVKEGEYLSTIAADNGYAQVQYRDIRKFNNDKSRVDKRIKFIYNDNMILPGWTLYIPPRSQLYGTHDRANNNHKTKPVIRFGEDVAIEIAGSATVYPLTVRAAECYRQSGFMGKITIKSTGTSDGIKQLCQRKIDIADASNEPSPKEIQDAGCNESDNKLIKLQVAVDAVGIYVNKRNRFFLNHPDISLDLNNDLPKLFKEFTNWGQMEVHLGLKQELGPQIGKIEKYLPTPKSGTLRFLIEKMFEKALRTSSDREREIEKYKGFLIDSASIKKENYYFLADMIESNENGIGFLGYAFFQNNTNIKPIKINGMVPLQQNIDDDTYPLKRPLYIYTSNNRVNYKRDGICSFITYYLRTVKNYVNEVGYFAIEEPRIPQFENDLNNFLMNECH